MAVGGSDTHGERLGRAAAALVLVLVLLLVAACSGEEAATTPAPTTPAVRTLPPVSAPPEPPPSGRLVAEMRQSSRDAAAGRIQVWLDNDTTAAVTPTRITYRDPRLRAPLAAERLRLAPAQSERGFPLVLPDRPACGFFGLYPINVGRTGATPSGSRRLEVRYGGRTVTLPVADPTDVVGRWARSRCLELEVAEVAALRWSDEVVAGGGPVAPGDTAGLTLLVVPTGVPGRVLEIETVGATPILSPVDGASAWSPGLRVRGDGRPRRLVLPVRPTRCDPHAFAESGGATAFRVRLRLDGEPGELVLRMDPAAAAAAIDFARRSCGL